MAKSTKAAKSSALTPFTSSWLTANHAQKLQFAADEWDISTRQGDQYIADARQKIEHDCTISRQEFLAETIVGLRSIRQQAERRGQFQVAVNSMRLMTELIGIDGKPS